MMSTLKTKSGQPVDFSKLPQPILKDHPEWVKLYSFAWKLAAGNIRETRNGRPYMDCAWDPKRNYQWVWDTCFMALFCRYGAKQYPGVQSLDNFYDLQRKDGYISMTYDLDRNREVYADRINPPLFPWVEWEYYRTTGDQSRLRHAIGHIERLAKWIDANRCTEPHRRLRSKKMEPKDLYQLYYFEDCGSSGMDDSPRTPRRPDAGKFFDWIDLSSQMVLAFSTLSRMHDVLDNRAESRRWAQRAAETGELINRELWCERTRFYHDRSIPRNFVAHKTVAGFWPLLAGLCPPDRVEALVAHLLNPEEFNRPVPVPTLSADDPNYSVQGVYWLGGVWAPTNYMITRGLMNVGRGDVAHDIARRYLDAMAKTYAQVSPHTLWECYAPEKNLPGLAAYSEKRVKPHFVGWTGVGPIAMLIENILGLDVNGAARKVVWDLRLIEEHGVRCLAVGAGLADFHCAGRRSAGALARVRVDSDQPFVLQLRRGTHSRTVKIEPGRPVTATI